MTVLLIVMSGLMAGVYFAFSVFVMKSLSLLAPLQAAQVMNKINDVIVNTVFLPVFFISTLWYAGLMMVSINDWQATRSLVTITAALVYIIGMFMVTVFGNVPLNNRLKACAVDERALPAYWPRYCHQWTRLNHVRMLSSVAACALLTMAQS